MGSVKGRALALIIAMVCLCGVILISVQTAYSEEQTQTRENTSSFKASGRIWIAGDSIAADHGYENEEDYLVFVHGWGEMIGNYLTDEAQVFNKAISGQTAKFFTDEENYRDIMNGIGEGDFLLIQFGHNDYKSAGSDHSTLSTETEGSYKWYLKNYYIDPALEAGAMPVLCTSVVCCQTDDIGMVLEVQDQAKFAEAMRELYQEYKEQGMEIGLIDTYALTHMYFNADSRNIRNYYAMKYDNWWDGTASLDHVHFSAKGADVVAQMIAHNLFLMYQDFNRFNVLQMTDGGEGTSSSPYLISSWLQFYEILQDEEKNTSQTYYELTEDLMPTIQQQEWVTAFYANLDGAGHTLKNVVGMGADRFLDENYGSISNLNLQYTVLNTSQNLYIPFVKDNYGTISGCSASGEIVFQNFQEKSGEVWNCGVFANVNHEGALVERCNNAANMSLYTDVGQIYIGGVVGCNEGEIRNCLNTGELSAVNFERDMSQASVYPQAVCCGGGIAGVTADKSDIMESESMKIPKCQTTLQSDIVLVRSDQVVPVTKDELQKMLLSTKLPQPSDLSNSSDLLQPSPGAQDVLMGDVNGDGTVGLDDVQLALQVYLEIEKIDHIQLKAVDFDHDGEIGLPEVQKTLNIYLS